MKFGKEVKKLRNIQKISQKDLASSVGIQRPYLSQIETCLYLPSKEVAEKLSIKLNDKELLKIFEEEKEFFRENQSVVQKETVKLLPANKEEKREVDIGMILYRAAFIPYTGTNFDSRKATNEILELTENFDKNKIHFLEIQEMLDELRKENQKLEKHFLKSIKHIFKLLDLNK